MSDKVLFKAQKNGTIITLGTDYWDATMRLIDLFNEKNIEIPTVKIPLFSALILGERMCGGKLRTLNKLARSSALQAVKTSLDLYIEMERYKKETEEPTTE